jgi:hypothetical protein
MPEKSKALKSRPGLAGEGEGEAPDADPGLVFLLCSLESFFSSEGEVVLSELEAIGIGYDLKNPSKKK